MDTAVRTIARPQFGKPLAGEGGTFEAVMKGELGAPDYLLILHQEHRDPAPWKEQMAWAKKLDADGHRDFRLPTRRELHALIANAKEKFNNNWYWSCEPDGSDYAWYQSFNNGNQNYNHQDNNNRACAVRRWHRHECTCRTPC